MNKKIFLIFLAILIGVLSSFFIYKQMTRPSVPSPTEEKTISYYTCPMHPHIHSDKPGECPICHMSLVPVYKEGTVPTNRTSGGPSVHISPERQQLIGIKTEAAQKKLVTKEIRTAGRVAFDPDLAVAQREFVEIAKNVPSLKSAAVSRLRLLGMGEEEIRALEHRQGAINRAPTNLYLPEKGDSVWVYATLYQGELEAMKPGIMAEISFSSGSSQTFTGTVRGIDSIIDPMTRSARARIEVPKAGGILRPDSFVNVTLKLDLGEAITVPKSAVINTGMRQVAFVAHEDDHFQSRDIKIGSTVGDEVVILEGIKEGEKVVSAAAFLVDSESQLKAAVSGMGEHKHD